MRLSRSPILVLGCLAAAACDVAIEATPPDASPRPFAPVAAPVEPPLAAGDHAGDLCACDTAACFQAWADAHLACDLCAVFVCDDVVVGHACNPCD